MGLFTENEELSRQGERVGFDRVQGVNKSLMSIMGYGDTGELNKWGKVTGGLGLSGNIAARGLSKGTDANTVLRKGTDEAFNQTASTAALGINIATAVGTGGLGTGAGSSLISKIRGNNKMDGITADLDKDVEDSTYSRGLEDKTDVLNFESPEAFAKHWEDKGFTVDPATNQILNPDGSIYTYDPDNPEGMSMGDAAMSVGEDAAGLAGKNALTDVLTGDVMGSAANALVSRKGYQSTLGMEADKLNYKKDLDTLNYL
jgi:hypothetical protein